MARITIELPASFSYRIDIPVRASDLNYGGHVGHDSLVSIMQEARVQFYRSLGFKNELNFEGSVGQVISDIAVVYKSEAFLGDVLTCSIAVGDFGKYGFDMIYAITHRETGREIARGKTGIVCFDYDRRKVARIPETLLARLPQHDTPSS